MKKSMGSEQPGNSKFPRGNNTLIHAKHPDELDQISNECATGRSSIQSTIKESNPLQDCQSEVSQYGQWKNLEGTSEGNLPSVSVFCDSSQARCAKDKESTVFKKPHDVKPYQRPSSSKDTKVSGEYVTNLSQQCVEVVNKRKRGSYPQRVISTRNESQDDVKQRVPQRSNPQYAIPAYSGFQNTVQPGESIAHILPISSESEGAILKGRGSSQSQYVMPASGEFHGTVQEGEAQRSFSNHTMTASSESQSLMQRRQLSSQDVKPTLSEFQSASQQRASQRSVYVGSIPKVSQSLAQQSTSTIVKTSNTTSQKNTTVIEQNKKIVAGLVAKVDNLPDDELVDATLNILERESTTLLAFCNELVTWYKVEAVPQAEKEGISIEEYIDKVGKDANWSTPPQYHTYAQQGKAIDFEEDYLTEKIQTSDKQQQVQWKSVLTNKHDETVVQIKRHLAPTQDHDEYISGSQLYQPPILRPDSDNAALKAQQAFMKMEGQQGTDGHNPGLANIYRQSLQYQEQLLQNVNNANNTLMSETAKRTTRPASIPHRIQMTRQLPIHPRMAAYNSDSAPTHSQCPEIVSLLQKPSNRSRSALQAGPRQEPKNSMPNSRQSKGNHPQFGSQHRRRYQVVGEPQLYTGQSNVPMQVPDPSHCMATSWRSQMPVENAHVHNPYSYGQQPTRQHQQQQHQQPQLDSGIYGGERLPPTSHFSQAQQMQCSNTRYTLNQPGQSGMGGSQFEQHRPIYQDQQNQQMQRNQCTESSFPSQGWPRL